MAGPNPSLRRAGWTARATRLGRAPATAALVLALAGACGSKGPPPLTLRQVMFEIDYADKDLQKVLGDPEAMGRLLESARRIQRWMGHESFDGYVRERSFRGDPQEFARERARFQQILDEFVGRVEAGDASAVVGPYGRLRMSCEVCHQRFRPGV